MASLQARSPLRSSHPLLILNKLLSLAAFLVLLGAGWVALSYFKTEVINPMRGVTAEDATATTTNKTIRTNEPDSVDAKRLTSPARLVYSCSGDSEYYHTSAHLPPRRERSALSEEAALQRGLKPCSVCLAK